MSCLNIGTYWRYSTFILGLLLVAAPSFARTIKHLRLATGPVDGSYRIIGEAIRRVIEDSSDDVQIDLVTTKGTPENIRLIREGKADLCLAQNDIVGEEVSHTSHNNDNHHLCTVLVLLKEPVQVVAGPLIGVHSLNGIEGHPVALGHRGGGSNHTARELLQALKLDYTEVPVESVSEEAQALRSLKAHAGFIVANAPSPQVASLLSDPDFRLMPFTTQEKQVLIETCPYYIWTTIQSHTYPNQTSDISTLAILNVLLCRADLLENDVFRLTGSLIKAATIPDSPLILARVARADSILEMTEYSAAPMHPGAARAVRDVPATIRLMARLQWIQWMGFIALASLMLVIAQSKSARLRLLTIASHFVPASLRSPVRLITFNKVIWHIIKTSSILSLVWLLGTAVMCGLEKDVNANFTDLNESGRSILVYLFSGLEDRAPVTPGGWIGSTLMLLSSLFVGAYITGRFASVIISHTMGVIQMTPGSAKGALLIIGWNPRAERVVREFFGAWEARLDEFTITVLSEEKVDDKSRSSEFESRGVTFVAGRTFDTKLLGRIGAHLARSIVILADDRKDAFGGSVEDADAKTALVVLAIRKLCEENSVPLPRICAEVLNHRKMDLIRTAGADEVICHEDFGLGVLAQSALSAEIAQVYQELLTFNRDTNEVYIISSPHDGDSGEIPEDIWHSHFEGRTFTEASALFNNYRHNRNPMILIGIRRAEKVILNPREELNLKAGDDLIVIAWDHEHLECLRSDIPD